MERTFSKSLLRYAIIDTGLSWFVFPKLAGPVEKKVSMNLATNTKEAVILELKPQLTVDLFFEIVKAVYDGVTIADKLAELAVKSI